MTALRVLDLTDELAWAGARLLVGLGADVIRVDPAEGLDPAARAHWHAGKRWVRGDLDELAAAADVVLESGPLGRLRGLRPDGTSRWPGAVHVVVTPFGLTGPRRHWLADDLILASAGGMTWLGGQADGPPKPPPRAQALQVAGVHGAIAALLGVLAGRGQLVDVSAPEAVAATLETAAIAWIHAGRYPVRNGGVYEHVAHRIFAAADGYVAGGYSGSVRMWTDLLAWLVETGEAEDLADDRWSDPVLRWQGRPHVDEVIARFAAKRTTAELASEGRSRALPWAEVTPPARLVENPQLRSRNFFVTIPGVGEDAGFPWDAPGLPRPVTLPPIAEAAMAWPGPRVERERRRRPLEGVRVLDLTWVLAGPYATKQLAEHGAEVIKIESGHRHDPTRFAPSMRLRPGAGPDDSGYFLNFNRNKKSVSLNLKTPDGQRLLRELAAHCDVVVENFSPGTLAKWGMDYESLRKLNPGVILVSMSGVGQTGPWRSAVTFADTLAAMSGLSSETADPGQPPQGLTFGLGDMVAANAAVLATLDLLIRGEGGYVDLSQLEAMAANMGPAVLDTTQPAPYGVYPTAGADRWIAISPATDDQRSALRNLTAGSALAEWTRSQNAACLATRLQSLGIPAALVATGQDLVDEDEQLAARGFYQVLEHPIAGPVRHEGIVPKLRATPGALTTPAPLLGQHTAEVLGELLGLDAEQLAALRAEGITE